MSTGGRLCTSQENPHFLVPTIKVRQPDGSFYSYSQTSQYLWTWTRATSTFGCPAGLYGVNRFELMDYYASRESRPINYCSNKKTARPACSLLPKRTPINRSTRNRWPLQLPFLFSSLGRADETRESWATIVFSSVTQYHCVLFSRNREIYQSSVLKNNKRKKKKKKARNQALLGTDLSGSRMCV